MNIIDLIRSLKYKNVLKMPNVDENNLSKTEKPINLISTGISGKIFVFKQLEKKFHIIQEEDQKHHFYYRLIDSEDVEMFLEQRMTIYEKM